jgi:hypothetical protein
VPLQQRPYHGLAGRAAGRRRHGRPRIRAGHARAADRKAGARWVGRQGSGAGI